MDFSERGVWSRGRPSTEKENRSLEEYGLAEYRKGYLGGRGKGKGNQGTFPCGDVEKAPKQVERNRTRGGACVRNAERTCMRNAGSCGAQTADEALGDCFETGRLYDGSWSVGSSTTGTRTGGRRPLRAHRRDFLRHVRGLRLAGAAAPAPHRPRGFGAAATEAD